MISVAEARKLIDQHRGLPKTVARPLPEAMGAILAEPIVSDRPLPPFNRVAMDGIAISAEAVKSGQRVFQKAGVQAAGAPPIALSNPMQALEIMTGAALPSGCEAVVPVERLVIDGETIRIIDDVAIEPWANIHLKASDCAEGTVLISKGQRIDGARAAIAASVGAATIEVYQMPRVSIVCTGDELVGYHESPAAHQIRECNSWSIVSMLASLGIKEPAVTTVRDDPEQMHKVMANALENSEIVLTIGGVSKGRYDYVPQILGDLKVRQHFHRLAQRPGKPLWYGTGVDGQQVFGLPGNPVSVLATAYAYVKPLIQTLLGQENAEEWVVLGETIEFSKDLTLFKAVRLGGELGELKAYPISNNGSGDFASLAESSGMVELPADTDTFLAGQPVRFHRW